MPLLFFQHVYYQSIGSDFDHTLIVMSSLLADRKAILQAVHTATEDLGFCRNRVWAVAKTLPGGAEQFPKILPPRERLSHKETREDHELCTFDFCEQSRVNFTLVKQRHEGFCEEARCKAKRFDLNYVAKAVDKGQRTVWDLEGIETLQRNERYMAISHVWSDGTGAGNQARGHVNICLLEFFRGFAEKFGCQGIWWDTICIPTTKDLREKALKRMQDNYMNAAVTLVHDCFLRECEWIDADSACFYIVMSPWFSRGWTALELQMSHKVQVIFKGPSGPITKDIDKDILQAKSPSIFHENKVAKGILKRLRGNKVSQLNDLLAILGSRHTSWPRDMAIISGLMIGIEMPDNYAHQKIYQEILQKISTISHAHLFHNSATMTNGYNWCPTNLYDLPVTLSKHNLQIEENGNLFGKWNFILLDDIKDKRFISGHAHPLIEAKVLLAREDEEDQHLLLIEPGLNSQETGISRGLLVKPSVKPDKNFLDCYCDYVGPVYFDPPLIESEIKGFHRTLLFNFHVGYDETCHNGSYQNTQLKKSARGMIEDMMKCPPNLEYRKRQTNLRTVNLATWDQLRIRDEFIKAVVDGKHEKVEELLKKVDEPDQADDSGWSALHHAAWRGHEGVARLLMKSCSLQKRSARGEEPLHLAAERGFKELVDMLLEGSTRDLPRGDGLNALHLAARNGFTRIVDTLLQEHWEINASDDKKQTALHMASFWGHEDVVHALSKKGADHTLKDNEQSTALSLAVFNGYEQPARLLIAAGADVNVQKMDYVTLLHLAVDQINNIALKILCRLGANLEAQDKIGRTPLHDAARQDNVDAIKILADHKGELEAQDKYGATPLHHAAVNNHVNAIKILAELQADLEAQDKHGQTPLYYAAANNEVDAIKILVELKADLEAQDEGGYTPLYRAAANNQVDAIKILAELGADLEARDKYSQTPLYRAAANNQVDAIELLAELGADFEAQDESGQTPLHRAAANNRIDAIKILAELEAELEAQDKYGQTPLHRAAEYGQVDAIKILVESKAEIEAQDKYGQTPLHIAAEYGQVDSIKILAELKAELEAQDTSSHTPLHIATEYGQVDSIKILSNLIASSKQV
ncbi:uncharacterized protein N7479_004766 [Penicillium vulpinum]|uniref:Uncharacterized protein n=1 Tax=Penicillium vulpinum TaxID=29845 RepID=A0A1V6RS57_9EURO|nr:uncharacterized protein N7479_004766 [Penicillium vulpinum]KAJ5964890.1 hypothetical protein N7479_004766 [Penicillium vulpinum]OQE04617.1 hypothetical protein PENVUL_c031G09148 [Penicillium vulpinum]